MNRIGLFLLAVVMAGLAGCGGGGGGDDDSDSVTDVAGIYTFTKLTITVDGSTITMAPPNLTGSLELTPTGTFTLRFTSSEGPGTVSGSFVVLDSTLTLSFVDDGEPYTMSGPVPDDGGKITLVLTVEGGQATYEFVRS